MSRTCRKSYIGDYPSAMVHPALCTPHSALETGVRGDGSSHGGRAPAGGYWAKVSPSTKWPITPGSVPKSNPKSDSPNGPPAAFSATPNSSPRATCEPARLLLLLRLRSEEVPVSRAAPGREKCAPHPPCSGINDEPVLTRFQLYVDRRYELPPVEAIPLQEWTLER